MIKNKRVLFSAVGAVVLSSALFMFPQKSEEGVYKTRVVQNEDQGQGIAGAFEYYRSIRLNAATGVYDAELVARGKAELELLAKNGDRADVSFLDQGPDNVGGRTRAILIDKDDFHHLYAGSVSGGLFESINRGNSWKKVEGFEENLAISSMCQTSSGAIYVATGHQQEGFFGGVDSGMNGSGVYVSTDNGVTFTLMAGSESLGYINEIVAQGDNVLIASVTGGLREYIASTNVLSVSDLAGVSGGCRSLSISKDGQVIVAAFTILNVTYVSDDGGSTFTDVSGNNTNDGKILKGKNRVEYAVSHEKVDGKYNIFASMSSGGKLAGVFHSANNGFFWTQIAPANLGNPGSFAPFGSNSQGEYDQIITVVPGAPESCLLGGINIHAKSVIGNWETRSNGFFPQQHALYVHSDQHEMQWDSQGRLWCGNDGGIFYSDDNGVSFKEADRGYNVTQFYSISASAHGDVLGGAQDNGTQINYHDNHSYQEHDQFSGGDGFGCEISFVNRNIVFSSIYFGFIYRSADRGLSTAQYPAEYMPPSYGTAGALVDGLGSFNTCIELYENPNDLNSTDFVSYRPDQSYNAGDTIKNIASKTSQQVLEIILTEGVTFQDSLHANASLTIQDTVVFDTTANVNLYDVSYSFLYGSWPVAVGDSLLIGSDTLHVDSIVYRDHYFGTNPGEPGEVVDMGSNSLVTNISWDTVQVQDIFQSWFALGLGQGKGIWLTRNATRFSSEDGFLQAGGGISGVVREMEFSKDGNHLFVGTSSGRLYRLSGLANIYSPNPKPGTGGGNIPDTSIVWTSTGDYTTETTFEEIKNFGSKPILGISVEKGNPDNVVVSLGGYGGAASVQRSLNATGSSVTFNSIVTGSTGSVLASVPCLSVVMDREDPDIVYVGTDYGLYRTLNGGGEWEFVNAPFGKTAIFDLKQDWRTWQEGSFKPGQIYVGTHGRGIWSTTEHLSIEDDSKDNIQLTGSISEMLVYPNPVVNQATISFKSNLNETATIRVYSLTGRLVNEMNNVSLNVGENLISLETSELAQGTYLVNLTTETASKTSKFIKQ